MEKKHLLSFTRDSLTKWLEEQHEKPFHAKQIMKWLYDRQVMDFDEMTDINKGLRAKMQASFTTELPEIIVDKTASDGTRKWVMQFSCGNSIETVYIPEENRGTLCISSQAGCALACPFCSTAHEGFNRNLSTAEIVAQVWIAEYILRKDSLQSRAITNVVLMGMGEPLVNFNQVLPATDIFMDDFGFGLSKRRVTISTSGIVPAIYKLCEVTDLSLAVSLHAPNDVLRNQIVPVNQRYGLQALLKACQQYVDHNRQHGGITWEYVMLKDVNDSLILAAELVDLLKDIRGKVNLIPFNEFPGSQYKCSSRNQILKFQRYLTENGVIATIRKTRGEDIDAACGQLVGDVLDRSRRERKLKRIEFSSCS